MFPLPAAPFRFETPLTSLLFPGKSDFWAQRQTGQMGSRPKSAQSQRLHARGEHPAKRRLLAQPPENLCETGMVGGAMRTRTKDPHCLRLRDGIGVVIGDLVGSDAPREQAILWINLSNQTNLLGLESSISWVCRALVSRESL
jgi:hypothetical protein